MAQTSRNLFWPQPPTLALVGIDIRCQRCKQRLDERVGVGGFSGDKQCEYVGAPEPVCTGSESRLADFGAEYEVAMVFEEFDHCGVEGGEPVGGGGAGAKWRVAADETLLQCAFVFVQECCGDGGAVWVATVEGAASDACGFGDVVHGDISGGALGEKLSGGVEDAGTVSGSVSSFHSTYLDTVSTSGLTGHGIGLPPPHPQIPLGQPRPDRARQRQPTAARDIAAMPTIPSRPRMVCGYNPPRLWMIAKICAQ